MTGLLGGVDEGGGWVRFKMKDGAPVSSDELEDDSEDADGEEDDDDDMDARIRYLSNFSACYSVHTPLSPLLFSGESVKHSTQYTPFFFPDETGRNLRRLLRYV